MATDIIDIKNFIDVSTSVASVTSAGRNFRDLCVVQKATDSEEMEVTTYTNLSELVDAEGSNSASVKAATVFYGGGFLGRKPNGTVTVAKIAEDTFTADFGELLTRPEFYLIVFDNAFTATTIKSAMALNEAATTTPHVLFVEDATKEAAEKDLSSDTNTVLGDGAAKNFTHSAGFYVDGSKTDAYHAAAGASYFGQVQFTTASQMGTLAWKTMSGISPLIFDGLTVSANTAWKNISDKKANGYITMGETGSVNFQKGTMFNGNDIADYISADYLNYKIRKAIYDLLTSVPKLPINDYGATLLNTVISSAFDNLYDAGVIGPGVAADGEVFGGKGYKVSVIPSTGTSKKNGIWDNIYCSALLSGATKKVVVGNTLKL